MSGWFTRNVPDPIFRPSQPALAMPQIWFCVTPGAPDMADALVAADPAVVDIFQVYAYAFMTEEIGLRGPNGWPHLAAAVSACRLPIAVETGAVKPQQPDEGIRQANVRLLQNAAENGTPARYVAIDEPFTAGMRMVEGDRQSMDVVAERATTVVLGSAHGDTQFGLIEAYPDFRLAELLPIIDRLTVLGWKPAFLHLDTDYNMIRQFKLHAACRGELRDLLTAVQVERGIPLGVCVWGHNDKDDPSWFRSAETLMGFYQQAFSAGNWPAHLIVQSWSAGWQDPAPRSIPSAMAQYAFLQRIRQSLS